MFNIHHGYANTTFGRIERICPGASSELGEVIIEINVGDALRVHSPKNIVAVQSFCICAGMILPAVAGMLGMEAAG